MASLFDNKETKTIVFNMLKVLGGVEAVVEFQGGGDSGEIHDACLLDAYGKEIDMDGVTYDWRVTTSYFDQDKKDWVQQTTIQPVELSDILRDTTEEMLEEQGLDWYNNDGGQGSMRIDLTQSPPTVTLQVGINYTTTDEHEFDYTDEEEDEETITSEEGK